MTTGMMDYLPATIATAALTVAAAPSTHSFNWWEFILNGLCRGAIYALVALGYTMVYGILGMINFAHGEVLMIGMFGTVFGIALATSIWGSSLVLNLILGVVFGMIICAGFGYSIERIAYRRLRGSHRLAPLTTAIGVSIILQNFIMLTVSKDQVQFPKFYSAWMESTHFGPAGFEISAIQLMILGSSILIMAALFYLVNRTRLGIAMRATAQDPMMASLSGISVQKIISMTFIIASALAAMAGSMLASYQGVLRFDHGALMGLKAFTAAVLGGIGNIPGAVLGGFIIGMAEDTTSITAGSDWKNLTIFCILMAVLIFRPRGILGERVADKV